MTCEQVRTPQRFCEEYNQTEGKILVQGNYDSTADYKVYMGCIPQNLSEEKIRSICETFGMLRSFNLVKDLEHPEKHKGFAFFEYVEEKVTDRAIKALNGLEFGDKKLKVQRSSIGQKPQHQQKQATAAGTIPSGPVNTGFLNNVPADKKIPIPAFSMTPSRVIQFINILTPEDLMDDQDYEGIKEDITSVCNVFGEVVDIRIPRPDPKTGMASAAVGRVFVKFSHVVAAKQAR